MVQRDVKEVTKHPRQNDTMKRTRDNVRWYDEERKVLRGNEENMDEREAEVVQMLLREGQEHVFEHWPEPGREESQKKKLLEQIVKLDDSYAGGLKKYLQNARRLLEESRMGINPFDEYTPSVPDGVTLGFGDSDFINYECEGIEAAGQSAFVLVAGGLGERLGYSGIKVALPVELATGKCFLQYYVEYILALQDESGTQHKLPLAIMTSGDTHEKTKELLEKNNNFGMEQGQIVLMKQEKVACLADNDAHVALSEDNKYQIQTKPHGHGDVHALLYSEGLAEKWKSQGLKWVCFFQDTNIQAFRTLPCALGVAKVKKYEVNSVCVPRRPKEAMGAITLLTHKDGSKMTLNVEYNQLDSLLRATIQPEGDVADSTGYSPLPGNINQLVFSLEPYLQTLQKTRGIIGEFVNPKYKDERKVEFKKSTRLECMMQDYPRALDSDASVGFMVIKDVWAACSPVKNSVDVAQAKAKAGEPTHSATASEMDFYRTNCYMLQLIGASIGDPVKRVFNGIPVDMYPHVCLAPNVCCTFRTLKYHFGDPMEMEIASNSTLIVDGSHIAVYRLKLRSGTLILKGAKGVMITLDRFTVRNKGWTWKALASGEGSEEEAMRGFTVERIEEEVYEYEEPGQYPLPDRF